MTRTRSQDNDPSKSKCSFTLYRYVSGKPSVYGTYTRSAVLDCDRIQATMTDTVTPTFEIDSKRGYIFNNPMSQSKTITRESTVPYSYSGTYFTGGGTRTGWWASGQINTSIFGTPANSSYYPELPDLEYDLDDLRDIAVTSAWANIDHSQAMIAASIAEGEKTVQSVASILYRAYKVFKAVKRLDYKYLKGQLAPRELADRYMEARYAIRPLIYDAAQISNALAYEEKKPFRQTFRGRSSKSSTNTTTGKISVHPTLDVNYSASAVRSVECYAGVLTQVDQVNKCNVWGLDAPLETIWELLPFSFIADWFFNFGKTIASFTPEKGTKPLASWCTSVITETRTVTAMNGSVTITPEFPLDCHASIPPMQMSQSIIQKERIVSPRRSVIPTFTVNLDTAKLLDLAIIIKKMIR